MADNAEFVENTERYRRELIAHCYRMLGSIQDAEDLVQETYLRAWRSFDEFEGRSSVRTWLYQIATNRCLTHLAKKSRRVLPSDLSAPEPDPHAELHVQGVGVEWIEPCPEFVAPDDSTDPAEVVGMREGLRLAFIASLQHLPPQQRAVLVLRDVLDFPAADVAAMLGTTTASVKSALQRARASMQALNLSHDEISEPAEPQARALLDRYVAAFQSSDAGEFEQLLVEHAVLEATPFRTWFSGRGTCIPFLRDQLLGSPGDWRMCTTRANGQPAAVAYRRGANGLYQPYGISVLTVSVQGIQRISSFGNPALLAAFGFEEDFTS